MKFIKIVLLVSALEFFLLGAYGVYTGIINVLSGGYADNILLGLLMMCTFPTVSLVAYVYISRLKEDVL